MRLLIALTPAGAAALLRGGGTFSSFAELDEWLLAGRTRPAAPRAAASPLVRTKKALLATMAISLAAYVSLGGTFASFSAETTNAGSSISSGTLTMDDQVDSGTLCLSQNGAVNVNPNCSKVVNVANVAPGVFTGSQTAQVTIRNTGSIDASNFYLYAPYVNATLSSPVSAGFTSGSISITALEGNVANGDTIRLTYGGQSQDFTATAGASGGATSLQVSGAAVTTTFPTGTIVTDRSSNASPTTTDCYDQLTTTPGTAGATKGTDLTSFVSASSNQLCRNVVMWVQETTGGPSGTGHYCWYGDGTGTATCTAPVSVTLSSAAACNSASLPVAALNGNVKSGDTVSVTSGSTTCTFTASAVAYVGATSISVTPVTGGATALASGSPVVNSSALSRLNSFNTNTISNFQTLHPYTGVVQLYPVTGNGTVNTTATVQLAHWNTGTYARTFQIGLYLPAPNGSNQNALQGLASTFGLSWHIEQ